VANSTIRAAKVDNEPDGRSGGTNHNSRGTCYTVRCMFSAAMYRKHRAFVPLLILALALNFTSPPSAARPAHAAADQPEVRSSAVLVLDESSATVLLARQADVATPIASITKLMSALVILGGRQSLEEVLEITAADREHGRGAHSRLAIGTRLSRGDLLHLALMSSENRAAHALARNYPGGLPGFVAAMNQRARSLGMSNAHFVDPTGLSSGDVASPADLSRLVIAASHEPLIQEYSTDEFHSVRAGRRVLEFRNTDLLVRNPAWNIIVQKTGYITEAGRCLVMKTLIRGRSVVIVLLDSFGKYTRVADARRIRKWLEARPLERALPGAA
jgi:serine-type D-Ala-D-Ala endopeptidase (penicillin-binding protein 7)